MRVETVVLGVLGTVALAGCILSPGHDRRHDHDRSRGHDSGSVSVGVGVEYTYFPSHHAYYHEPSHAWYVRDGRAWTRTTVRPASIVIADDTPWVVVKVEGSEPQVRYEEHEREYPPHWRGKGPKGPPPGRGWRK